MEAAVRKTVVAIGGPGRPGHAFPWRRAVEWPTLALALGCYVAWIVLTSLAPAASGASTDPAAGLATGSAAGGFWLEAARWLALVALLVLHSSLQHECIHGHPFRSRRANDALASPPLGLLVPYGRFRATHLAHHVDAHLTDPRLDPESNYVDPATWAGYGAWRRTLMRLGTTLPGHVTIGALLGYAAFVRRDLVALRSRTTGGASSGVSPTCIAHDGTARDDMARDDMARDDMARDDIARDWAVHALTLVPVLAWVAWSPMRLDAYALAAVAAAAVLRIRTFAEHRAHESVAGRSALVEDRGPLAWLFLNNNLHALHHAHPRLPWYRLPAVHERRRERLLERNGGYRYRSYAELAVRHWRRPKGPVVHPGLVERDERGDGGRPCKDP